MFILSHPTGNAFVRAAARALHTSGRLHAFHTTVVAPRLEWPAPAGPMRRLLSRRRFDEIPRRLIRTHPWRESVRLLAPTIGLNRLSRKGAWAGIDAVYEQFDRDVAAEIGRLPARDSVAGVYGYEDASVHTFRSARSLGLTCVYELPIAHWATTQRLLREEADRLPAWRPTLRGIDDPDEKLERKALELELADAIFVPSRFVLETLPPAILTGKPCLVAPFGSPFPHADDRRVRQPTDRLRVLFAGAMTQRKGLADLFAAMKLVDRSDVELVVMGSPLAPMSFYRGQCPGFVYEGPRSHDEVLSLMRTCDVLALPSIVEGRALVQQEALASGLPLLVTPNAGGEDLVEQGKTGFLVPIRAPAVLAERITWFADHRSALVAMRQAAKAKALATGWAQYERRLGEAVSVATHRRCRVDSCAS
ncbi:MAG: glycosyltransferase [Acidobacteria bacterium]|nr:MAG: glycosyltransferase [Acidobacteriota bacterium]